MPELSILGRSLVGQVPDFSAYWSARRRSGVVLAVLVGLVGFSYFLIAGLLSGAEAAVTIFRAVALVLLGGFCAYLIRWRTSNPLVLYCLSSLVSFSTILMVVVVVSHKPATLSLTWLELCAPLFLALCVHYFALRLEPSLALLIGGGLSALMMFQVSFLASPDSSAIHAIFYVVALNLFGFGWLCINKGHDQAVFDDVQRLRQIDSLQRRLLFVIEHELRQPLLALRTMTGTVAHGSCPGDQTNRLSAIFDAVRLVDNTLEYLHTWGRVVSGDGGFAVSPVKISEVVSDVIALTKIEATSRGVRLDVDSEAADLVVWSNSSAIRQVLVNLLINAVRHSPGSFDGKASVRVIVRVRAHACSVFVVDNGVGIPAALRKDLWLPFKTGAHIGAESRGKGATREGVSGLGLYLVDTTIRNMSGHSVRFRSIVGRGTIFRVQIPLSSPPGAHESDEYRHESIFGVGGGKDDAPDVIVLFDSNKEAALRVRDSLVGEGFSVAVRESSEVVGSVRLKDATLKRPMVCVDQTSLSRLWGWKKSLTVSVTASSPLIYLGYREQDIPESGVIVLPDTPQGSTILVGVVRLALRSAASKADS